MAADPNIAVFVQNLKSVLSVELEAKTNKFNALIAHLLTTLKRFFPSDEKVGEYLTLFDTIRRPTASLDTRMKPAMAFFDVIYAPMIKTDPTTPLIADQLLEKDINALYLTMSKFSFLESIGFEDKWKKLTVKNKKAMWELIRQLVAVSITIVNFKNVNPEQFIDLIMKAKGELKLEDLAEMAKGLLEKKVEDPAPEPQQQSEKQN